MKKRATEHPARARFPDGFAVMAEQLKDILNRADAAAVPIERWKDEHFERIRARVRKFFVDTRNDTNAARWRQKAQEEGVTVDPAEIAADAKYVRNHFKLIEPEAIRAIELLRQRVQNVRTRDAMLIYLREWRDASLDPNIPPRVLGQTLRDLLTNNHIEVPSDGVTMGMLKAIERADFDADRNEWPTAQGLATSKAGPEHWTYELMPPDAASAREELLPAPDLDAKVRAAMADYAKQLGDRDSDLMTFTMARFAERAKNPDDKVVIRLDELMDALGYQRNRGGADGEAFTAKDKAVVREQVEKLESGFLTVRKAGKLAGSTRKVDIESRVLIIEDRAGQADLAGRVRDWTAITVRFGRAWSTRLFDARGRMTALLQAQALSYDAIKERIEKRLLKRLGWYWKLNDHPITTPRTVAVWVRDDVGDDPSDYQRRDAERLERAFDRLKADGNIADWRYAGGELRVSETDGTMVRGWLERWLEREIVVEAPESLRMAYAARRKPVEAQAMLAALPMPREAGGDDFGRQVRAFRVRYGITGLAAAEQLGIGNTVLSKIENGKRDATPEQRKLIENWMRELRNRPDKVRDLHG
jgi:hypothetical protein